MKGISTRAMGVVFAAVLLPAAIGQTPQKHRPSKDDPSSNAATCIANTASTVPLKVINKYSASNSEPDLLVKVYSDGTADVYADQRVVDAYINYSGAYYGEFSGPLYYTFRDETTRQSFVHRIRDNRPASFQPNMTCAVLDPKYGTPIRRNADCANGGPSRNLDFLKYIAADITFTKHGPGNVLLPPGATMPGRLLIVGTVLYLSSPRCAGVDSFTERISKSISPQEEYIDALDQMNPSLIGGTYGGSNRDEFMSLFVNDPGKMTTSLPGYYQVGEADTSLLYRSVLGVVSKIAEGRNLKSESKLPR